MRPSASTDSKNPAKSSSDLGTSGNQPPGPPYTHALSPQSENNPPSPGQESRPGRATRQTLPHPPHQTLPTGTERWPSPRHLRRAGCPVARRPSREGHTPHIFLNAAHTNKGRQDGKPIGAAAAVLYFRGKEWGHLEYTLGDQVTRMDAETGALSLLPALALLSNFLTSSRYAGPVRLVTRSEEAAKRFLNLR